MAKSAICFRRRTDSFAEMECTLFKMLKATSRSKFPFARRGFWTEDYGTRLRSPLGKDGQQHSIPRLMAEACNSKPMGNWQKRFLSGKWFVNLRRLRINAFPTKSLTTIGKHRDRNCQAGCHQKETLNRILQSCHQTHGTRVKEYEVVTAYVVAIVNSPGTGLTLFSIHSYPERVLSYCVDDKY